MMRRLRLQPVGAGECHGRSPALVRHVWRPHDDRMHGPEKFDRSARQESVSDLVPAGGRSRPSLAALGGCGMRAGDEAFFTELTGGGAQVGRPAHHITVAAQDLGDPGMPPTRVATIGVPAAIASRTTTGSPSVERRHSQGLDGVGQPFLVRHSTARLLRSRLTPRLPKERAVRTPPRAPTERRSFESHSESTGRRRQQCEGGFSTEDGRGGMRERIACGAAGARWR